ncbi:MAG: hypothetical protein U0587_06965 [Candidatus Binatia bacterium]
MHVDRDPEDVAIFKQRLAKDPICFIEYPAEVVFSLPPAELDDIRLPLAQQKFAAARDRVPMVRQLANQNQISAIGSFNDLLPVCYNQEAFKSYPQSWLETGDFKRLTKWLSKLCAADLSAVDASSCELIEDWIAVLKQQSSVDLMISASADGKASFLPRTRQEWVTFQRVSFWGVQSLLKGPKGESQALRPGVDRVPLVYLGARRGARSWRFLDFYEETFGPGLVDTSLDYIDSDLLTLAGRIREASKKGEAGSLQISPQLLARKDEIARLNAEKPQRVEALMQRLLNEYRGRRIIFYSSMQMLYDLALRFKAQGVKGAYAPDSYFSCGGGFADGKEPPNWRQDVTEALGISESAIHVGYGMQEALSGMQMCGQRKYHVPVIMIPFVLDEATDRPLPRTGRQTGRFALFDLLQDTSWGGFITSDRVTITWDRPCGCGRKGAYLDAAISKVVDKQDDKIGCAGTAGALADATDFLLKA